MCQSAGHSAILARTSSLRPCNSAAKIWLFAVWRVVLYDLECSWQQLVEKFELVKNRWKSEVPCSMVVPNFVDGVCSHETELKAPGHTVWKIISWTTRKNSKHTFSYFKVLHVHLKTKNSGEAHFFVLLKI